MNDDNSVAAEPSESAASLADFWELDPAVTYLNHGSFGPSPRPVLEARAALTQQLERQPMSFFCQQMEVELEHTEARLAQWLGTRPERIVCVPNATHAMNAVATSTLLNPDDEVLLTDHEYGAVRNIWQQRCRSSGARLVTARLPFPPDDEGVATTIGESLTPRTRLIVISHVTSATACRLPVAEVCRIARGRDIPVCVDGPHAIAMLDVELDQLGCDFYCASGHKWLCAPFGSGFLWVHPRHHGQIRSPVVSWGGSLSGRPKSWKDSLHWEGTRDPSSLLAISAAVDFFSRDRLRILRQHGHELVGYAWQSLLQLPEVQPFCMRREAEFLSMCAVSLPAPDNWQPGYHGCPDPLQAELRDRFQIEVPVGSWNGHRYLRVSAHLYNTRSQIDYLIESLKAADSLRC